jgi:SNF2 family DNA or RNA helicase
MFALRFVNTVIATGLQNVMKMDARFSTLLKTAGFGFKKYQYDGVKWCVQNEKKNINFNNVISTNVRGPYVRGGLIADEMGLGKTLLMIGTMFTNFLPKTIIIVPPILIEQWANEIYKCSGHKPLVYYGKNKKSIGIKELNSKSVCIVLTTYNTLLPSKRFTHLMRENDLFSIKWDRVVFDEAHHLRNPKTVCFNCCKKIVAPIRWLISGTPIQNKRTDFYSLCNMIGFDKSFYKSKDVSTLNYIKTHHILRRTKAEVGIELPPVIKTNIVVPWTNVGEKLLSQEIHSLISNQSGVSFDKGKDVASSIVGNNRATIVLLAMLRARQSCVLPSLMKKSIDSCILADKTGMYLNAVLSSSKLDAVVKLILDRKDNGKGKIVFCHYIDEIDTIASRLRDGGVSKVVTYDGKKVFLKADVIILQIQTGCEGLNLQEFFSEIYFVSPHWNPAVEDQAIARCHRIGQKVDVNVFKFEMDGFDKDLMLDFAPLTLDKYVNRIQDVKRDIASEII